MILFDLHVHTLFSHCGIHTALEVLARANELGMRGIAITDHGPALPGGRLNNPFFERFKSPYPNVELLKGMECNVVDDQGKIDLPPQFKKFMDVVLLGLHPNIPTGQSKETYTAMLINAIEKNPCVDIITHPNDPNYPVDYKRLAQAAKAAGVALELNNSKILYARAEKKSAAELVMACKHEGCRIVVNSDTHAIHELGLDDSVKPILHSLEFPIDLVVNRFEKTTMEFINSRRSNKSS
jgi:putative hydrolase